MVSCGEVLAKKLYSVVPDVKVEQGCFVVFHEQLVTGWNPAVLREMRRGRCHRGI